MLAPDAAPHVADAIAAASVLAIGGAARITGRARQAAHCCCVWRGGARASGNSL